MTQNSRRTTEPHELFVVQLPFAAALCIHTAFGSKEALNELLLAHLQREKRDRNIVIERGVLGNVEHESGFPHRWTGGDDDEIRGLETCRELVKILESAGDARNRTTSALDLLAPLHRRPEKLLDAHEAFGPATLVDLEDLVLGFVEQLSRGRGGLERFRNNGRRDLDKAAAQCLLTND